ncbi:hypothetical protein TRFO_34461 [Tritrichomonas foetus]|uniref:Uncharacterized protein n=1 Tax=Tritrichomonas foetus TaxID=1144522 RepID=A0A1J4JPE9_9EUKA|nr:hypothetical protein TRFO_34461 [Tritrichomonas foetus]|eukprot:OHS99148.1 hypothetical protein TRFO_34461 [Tritrichomonas foetus]
MSQLRTNNASAYEQLPELSQLSLSNSKFLNHFSSMKCSSTLIMNPNNLPVTPLINFPVHTHHKPVEPSVVHIESDTSRVTQPNYQNSDDIIDNSNYNEFKNGQHGHLLNLHGDQNETDVDKIFINFDFSLGCCSFNDEFCDFGISNTNNKDLLEHN